MYNQGWKTLNLWKLKTKCPKTGVSPDMADEDQLMLLVSKCFTILQLMSECLTKSGLSLEDSNTNSVQERESEEIEWICPSLAKVK